jgi:hypothetical protein
MTKAEETCTPDGLTCAHQFPVLPGGGWDQVVRLEAFRRQPPTIIIGAIEFGCWQALIFEGNGETVTVRHSLEELLDKLGETLGEPGRSAGNGAVSDHVPGV